MANSGGCITDQVVGTSFNFYSADEVRKISVKRITTALSFDGLGHPVKGGLYDPSLGPTERTLRCPTCLLNSDECPGHCGHIELVVPVYHPLLFGKLFDILRRKCFSCHRFKLPSLRTRVFAVKLLLIDHGELIRATNLDEELLSRDRCPDETLAEEIKRQTEILERIEDEFGEPDSPPSSLHARELRANLIHEFFKSIPVKACANCGAMPLRLRREGTLKIFQQPLSKKARDSMMQMGLRFGSALKEAEAEHGLATADSDDEDAWSREDSDDNDESGDDDETNEKPQLMPVSEIEMQMRALWRAEPQITARIWGRRFGLYAKQPSTAAGWAQFFLRVLPVPPSRFRPPAVMEGMVFEHAQNVRLSKILNLNEQLITAGAGSSRELGGEEAETAADSAEPKKSVDMNQVIRLWILLQDAVNVLIDASKAQGYEDRTSGSGIKQLLEKKEGLFRKNMMGKRVNFAARSVISPDPYIRTDQIGVPVRFAKVLTYAEPVTAWNVEKLRRLVMNGPSVHPGANFVEDERGRRIDLSKRSPVQREAIAKTLLTQSSDGSGLPRSKRVWRHLQNDDVVLMNRQPTLHKPSIMAHRARVLTAGDEQPIRMHYANCKTFNADFDGDEMNMHFPQDELSRAEAYTIAACPYQYLVPTTGSPIRGLIQDHVGVAVLLTKRDTFLTRDEYQQLVYAAVEGLPQYQRDPTAPIKLLPPTILKPEPLWTGKQVISSLLFALTGDLPSPANLMDLDQSAMVSAKLWGTPAGEPGDHMIVIRQNELLLGVIDKKSIGSSAYGLVHSVYELYGPERAGALLSAFGRLLTVYLQRVGISCGLEDLVLSPEADADRQKLIGAALAEGAQASAKFVGIEDGNMQTEDGMFDQKWVEKIRAATRKRLVRAVAAEGASVNTEAGIALDNAVKSVLSKAHTNIISRCLSTGLRRVFPSNMFSLMIGTGAKGAPVNHAMIVGGLGQQDLEGRRVPLMVSGKSLPSFPSYHPSPRAGGYVSDRFLTGLRPQDYYFHCMSGREGLVDTAVKTSRSGYLQRCLIKHLEDLSVHYDYSVRDSEGNVLQFVYGEDGLDVCKTSYLKGSDDQLAFLLKNHKAVIHQLRMDNPSMYESFDFMAAPALHESIQSARRAVEVFSKNPSLPPRKGANVEIRCRIDKSKPWAADNLMASWVQGVVTKVRKGSESAPPTPGKKSKKSKKHAEPEESDVGSCDIELTVTGKKLRKVPLRIAGLSKPFIRPFVPDPVVSQLPHAGHVGVVSERFQDRMEAFVEKNPGGLLDKGDGESENAIMSVSAFNSLMWIKSMRSCVDPGEPVGVLAGQSVGEPSTQMTLNTFHLAGHGGVNVTLGIPRLREIVMTASANIKTPAMTLPLLPSLQGRRSVAAAAARQLSRLSLGQLLDSTRADGGLAVVDELVPKNPIAASEPTSEWVRQYRIRLHFIDPSIIEEAFTLTFADVANCVGSAFTQALLVLIKTTLRKNNDPLFRKSIDTSRATGTSSNEDDSMGVGVVKASNSAVLRAMESGEDGEADGGEGASASTKKKKGDDDDDDDDDEGAGAEEGNIRLGRRKEVKGYDDDDDADDDEDGGGAGAGAGRASGDESSDDAAPASSAGKGGHKPSTTPTGSTHSHMRVIGEDNLFRVVVPKLVSGSRFFSDCVYNPEEAWVEVTVAFPPSARKILMLNNAEIAVNKALVRHTRGITRCVVSKQDVGDLKDQLCVQSEGVNFQAVWEFDSVFDVNKIASNDIAAILRFYGVEAARSAITREIRAVFGVYGIKVDPRHLGLIADYMTYSGGYRAMNRGGMDGNASPYLQMSFETTARFLTNACVDGQPDPINSSSARIVMGRVVESGTGAFDLLHPIKL